MQEEKLDKILNLLNSLYLKVNELDDKVNKLIENQRNIENDCSKMKGHINFVEDTYEKVREPLNFITEQVNYILGYENRELPVIEDKKVSILLDLSNSKEECKLE